MSAAHRRTGTTTSVWSSEPAGLIGTERRSAATSADRRPWGRGASLAFALIAATGGVLASPALADRDDGGFRGRERGHEHGRGHERRYEHHHYRVYAPSPVYYRREASPGVSLFIPFDLR